MAVDAVRLRRDRLRVYGVICRGENGAQSALVTGALD